MVDSFWKVARAHRAAAPRAARDWLAEPWCLKRPQAQLYQSLASVHLQGQKTKLNVMPVGKAVPLQCHPPGNSFVTFLPGSALRAFGAGAFAEDR